MPYKAPITRVNYSYRPTTNPKPEVKVNCGCFGCLISILGLIGILWILFHLSEIAAFITG